MGILARRSTVDERRHPYRAHSQRSNRDCAHACAAWAGVTLDRRGVNRMVEFTASGRAGSRVQLSGGWQVMRSRDRFEMRGIVEREKRQDDIRLLKPPMAWDRWAFSIGKPRRSSD